MIKSLISGGLSLADNALQYKRQKELDEAERQFQSAEAQKAYDRQIDFWNKQNEYNLPANQRKRLEDAGYNILDLMRNGSAVHQAGSLSPVATAGAGRGSQAPIGTLADSFANVASLRSQIDLNDSAKNLNEMRARAEELDNVRRTIENLEKTDTREARLRLDYYYQYEKRLLEGMQYTNDNIQAKTAESKSNKLALDALATLRSEQFNTEKSRQALNNASVQDYINKAKTYVAQVGLSDKEAQYYIQLARNVGSEADKAGYVFDQLKQNGLDVSQGGLFGTAERLTNVAWNKTSEFLTWLLSMFK